MAEFPALPLWTDAYLGDTTHLTTIEHGAYLLLLVTAWRSSGCSLPDNDNLLARYARCTAGQWKRLRPILEPFFIVEKGMWRQARLIDEREAVRRHSEQQSAKGKAGAAAKALKRQQRTKAAAKSGLTPASAQDQPDASSQSLTHSSEDKSSDGEPSSDPVKILFDTGIAVLTTAGKSETQARSLIGKWRKEKGDAEVMAAFFDCRSHYPPVSEPVEWLTKRLKPAKYVSKSGYEYRGDLKSVQREAEKRADWDTYWGVTRDIRLAHEARNGKAKAAA